MLLGSRRTPLHQTKALSSSESTVAMRVPQFEHFLGKALHPGAGRRFFQLARHVETLGCQGTDAESRRASKGSVHAKISTCRGPKPSGVTLPERLTRKSNGDKLPHLEHRNFNSPWNHKISAIQKYCVGSRCRFG